MFAQTLSEVKMETLSSHDFHPWLNFVTLLCDRREVQFTPMIGTDAHIVFSILDIHSFELYQIERLK